jgi:hypothetical protein
VPVGAQVRLSLDPSRVAVLPENGSQTASRPSLESRM